jgi:hypothetical protein
MGRHPVESRVVPVAIGVRYDVPVVGSSAELCVIPVNDREAR